MQDTTEHESAPHEVEPDPFDEEGIEEIEERERAARWHAAAGSARARGRFADVKDELEVRVAAAAGLGDRKAADALLRRALADADRARSRIGAASAVRRRPTVKRAPRRSRRARTRRAATMTKASSADAPPPPRLRALAGSIGGAS